MKCFNHSKIKLLILFFLFSSLKMLAQNGTVTGTVKDAAGTPLTDASVVVQAGKLGTRTTADGKFSLSVPAGTYMLIASFTGKSLTQKQVTLAAGEAVSMDFTLADAGDLEGILVIGSRTPRRVSTETASPAANVTCF